MAPTVSKLTNCPDEILVCITDKIHASEFEAFALTCKRIYEFFVPRLQEHATRKNLYTRIAFNGGYSDWYNGTTTFDTRYPNYRNFGNPANFLNEVFKYPEIVRYVTHVVFESTYAHDKGLGLPDDWIEDLNGSNYGPDYIGAIVPTLKNDNITKNLWQTKVEAGSQEAIAALALSLLPNLKSLSLEWHHSWRNHKDFIGKIVDDTVANLDQRDHTNPNQYDLPLAKLESFSWTWSKPLERSLLPEMEMFAHMMKLPSLKSLHGPVASLSDEDIMTFPNSSSITAIDFRGGLLSKPNFVRLLQSTTNRLKKFQYSFNEHRNENGMLRHTDAPGLVEVLKNEAAQSLEALTLIPAFGDPCVYERTNFNCFEKLRILELDIDFLAPKVLYDIIALTAEERRDYFRSPVRIEDIVPPSLEYLAIHAYLPNSIIDIQGLFKSFATEYYKLPNLRDIAIHCHDAISADIELQIAPSGVRLEYVQITGRMKAFWADEDRYKWPNRPNHHGHWVFRSPLEYFQYDYDTDSSDANYT